MTQEMIIDHYFGRDYARWSHGHRWLMLYLDARYVSILGHQGILCYLPFFGGLGMPLRSIFKKIVCIMTIMATLLSFLA